MRKKERTLTMACKRASVNLSKKMIIKVKTKKAASVYWVSMIKCLFCYFRWECDWWRWCDCDDDECFRYYCFVLTPTQLVFQVLLQLPRWVLERFQEQKIIENRWQNLQTLDPLAFASVVYCELFVYCVNTHQIYNTNSHWNKSISSIN